MDPTSAIGLAANVLDFLDFARQWIKLAERLHQYQRDSGESDTHVHLLRLTQNVEGVLPELAEEQKSLKSLKSLDISLAQLAFDSDKMAKQLSVMLAKLQSSDKANQRDSIEVAS